MENQENSLRWKCKCCSMHFKTRYLLKLHKKEEHHFSFYNPNVGKIAIHFDDIKNKYVYENELFAYLSQGWEYGQYQHGNYGKAATEEKELERKKKISESMKKAAECGRNRGWATTKKQLGGMSYPEKYFETCILNSFDDKKYTYNHPVGKYKLDFAWIDKHIYIEIDGEQHYKEYFINKDKEREEFLENNGWKLIKRIRWSEFQKLSRNEKEQIIKNISNMINEMHIN